MPARPGFSAWEQEAADGSGCRPRLGGSRRKHPPVSHFLDCGGTRGERDSSPSGQANGPKKSNRVQKAPQLRQ